VCQVLHQPVIELQLRDTSLDVLLKPRHGPIKLVGKHGDGFGICIARPGGPQLGQSPCHVVYERPELLDGGLNLAYCELDLGRCGCSRLRCIDVLAGSRHLLRPLP
jgi:hypothetical protein